MNKTERRLNRVEWVLLVLAFASAMQGIAHLGRIFIETKSTTELAKLKEVLSQQQCLREPASK